MVHQRALEIGIGAGLLGEMVLSGHLNIVAGALQVVDRRPPGDALTHWTLGQLLSEPAVRDVRPWLEYLGEHGVGRVAERLAQDGLLERHTPRWRGKVRYTPVNPTDAWSTGARLHSALVNNRPLPDLDLVLVGVVRAIGLDRVVLVDVSPPVAQRWMAGCVSALPPALRALVARVEAIVGDVALTHLT